MKKVFLIALVFSVLGCESVVVNTIIKLSGQVELESQKESSGNICFTINTEILDNTEGESEWQKLSAEEVCQKIVIQEDGKYQADLSIKRTLNPNYDYRISKISKISLKTNKYEDPLAPKGKFRANTYFSKAVSNPKLQGPEVMEEESMVVMTSIELNFTLKTYDFEKEYSFDDIARGCKVIDNTRLKKHCIDNDMPPTIVKSCREFATVPNIVGNISVESLRNCFNKYLSDIN